MTGITIRNERCKGCMLCAHVCPKHVIAESREINKDGYTYAVVSDPGACIGCGMCAAMCPDCAIQIVRGGRIVAGKPALIREELSTYCGGCSHGVVQRLLAEVIEEMGGRGNFIGVTPIGCSVFIYKVVDIDFIEGAHGRAPAVATGVKDVHPDKYVFTYQGDGDIASIGISEIMHAGIRNEKIAAIFINNGNFGMTGGQAAPTTLIGQITSSTPNGKTVSSGLPVHVAELLAQVTDENAYIVRCAVDTPQHVRETGKCIGKAFKNTEQGFSLVEILGLCPSNWKKTPIEALNWLQNDMEAVYPLGAIKERGGK